MPQMMDKMDLFRFAVIDYYYSTTKRVIDAFIRFARANPDLIDDEYAWMITPDVDERRRNRLVYDVFNAYVDDVKNERSAK